MRIKIFEIIKKYIFLTFLLQFILIYIQPFCKILYCKNFGLPVIVRIRVINKYINEKIKTINCRAAEEKNI